MSNAVLLFSVRLRHGVNAVQAISMPITIGCIDSSWVQDACNTLR